MYSSDAEKGSADDSLAIRAAWLCYVHGLTQAQAADHLGISRVKVHRLVARAHEQSWIKVFVEGSTAQGIALEQALKARFALDYCNVVPSDIDSHGAHAAAGLRSLGAAGALHLHQYLERHPQAAIGVGHGRTLAAVADAMPKVPRPQCHFVSLLGSLTRRATANPYDVIYRFAERTGGEGYFLPAPFFVDSVDDAIVLRGQRLVGEILAKAARTQLVLLGIGNLRNAPAIYESERKALAALGIVSEVLGQFLDADGRVVDCDMAQRSIGVRLDALRHRAVIGIAAGAEKVVAIRATLRSGLLTGLVTDEATARAVLEQRAPRRSGAPRAPASARA